MLDDRTLERFSTTIAQSADRWRRTPEGEKKYLGELLDAMVVSRNPISAGIGWLALAGLLTIVRGLAEDDDRRRQENADG